MTTPMETLLNQVNWAAYDPAMLKPSTEMPHATHEGLLSFGVINLRVYQLSNGQRVIDAGDVHKMFECNETITDFAAIDPDIQDEIDRVLKD